MLLDYFNFLILKKNLKIKKKFHTFTIKKHFKKYHGSPCTRWFPSWITTHRLIQ